VTSGRTARGSAPPATVDPLGEALGRLLEQAEHRLEPFIKRTVAEVLAEHRAAERAKPEWVDCTTMAQLLDCSPAQIHRLCREDGLPFVRLGEVKRFNPRAVYEFLEARTREREAATVGVEAVDVAEPTAPVTPLRSVRRGGAR